MSSNTVSWGGDWHDAWESMRFLFRICWGQPQEATRLLELDASGQD